MSTLSSQTIGQGPDLVLLHGWGMNKGVWTKFAPQLAHHFKVTMIDLPGYEIPITPESYSSHQLTDIAKQLLTAAPKKALWIGWSLGGLIATHIAAYFPERVQGLITLATNLKFVACDTWTCGVDDTIFNRFQQELNYNVDSTLWRFLSLSVLGARDMSQHLRTLRSLLPKPLPHLETLIDGLFILQHSDLRPLLTQIKIPVLSILGENDALVPKHCATAITQACQRIQTHVIKHAAHAPFLTHPDTTLSLIKQYHHERITEPEYH